MNLLLDSYAFLELLQPSPKADKVKELVESADQVYTTVMNLYEVRYRVTQKSSRHTADAYIASIKTTSHVLAINEETAMAASDIKTKHPRMGAVDCVTLAAARRVGLTVVTGDPDFPKDSDVIQL